MVFAARKRWILEENTPEDLKPIQNAMLTERRLWHDQHRGRVGKFKTRTILRRRFGRGRRDHLDVTVHAFVLHSCDFSLEASLLMFISKNRVNQWKEWNEIATEDDKLKKTLRQHAVDMADGKSVNHEKLIFLAIRQRFVFHKKAHENHKTPLDFEFHRYLGSCAGKTIGHLVEIDIKNWATLWALFVVFWGLHWSLKSNRDVYIVGVS